MPAGVARVAVDSLFGLFAQNRHTYPLGGFAVLHDVMMAAAPFWLDPSAEPVSHAIRESTALEVRDWVVWVEAQLYEVLAG